MGRTKSANSRKGSEGETRSREPDDPPEPPTQPESVPSTGEESPEEYSDTESPSTTEDVEHYTSDESEKTIAEAEDEYEEIASERFSRDITETETETVEDSADTTDISTSPDATEQSDRALEYDPEIHESPTNLQQTTESEADAEAEVEREVAQVQDLAESSDGSVAVDQEVFEKLQATRQQEQQAQTDAENLPDENLGVGGSLETQENSPSERRTSDASGSTLEASRGGGTASGRAQAAVVTQANADQFDSEQIRTVDGQQVAVTGETESITQEREEEILGEKARQLNQVEQEIAALREEIGEEEFGEIRDEIIRNYNDTGDATPSGFEESSLKTIAASQAGETITATGLTKYVDSADHEQTLRNSSIKQDERRTEASRDATDAPELTETTNFLADVDDDTAARYERNGARALNSELTNQQRQSILNLAKQRLPDDAVRSDTHETLAAQALGQAAVPKIDPSLADVDQNTTAGDLLKQGNNSLAVTRSEYADAMETISQAAYSGDSAEFERFRPDTRQDRRQVREFANGPTPTVQDALSELPITVSRQGSDPQPVFTMTDRLGDDLGIGSRTFRQEVGSAMTRPAEADGSGADFQIFESEPNPFGEDSLEFTGLEKELKQHQGHLSETRYNAYNRRLSDDAEFNQLITSTNSYADLDKAVSYNPHKAETEVGSTGESETDTYIGRSTTDSDGEKHSLQDLINGDIEIGDRGWLGNPHELEDGHTQEELEASITSYEEDLMTALDEVDGFADAVTDLHGETLEGFCRTSSQEYYEGAQCHGDALVVAAEAGHEHGTEALKDADSLSSINPIKPGSDFDHFYPDTYDGFSETADTESFDQLAATHSTSISDLSGGLGEASEFAMATRNGDFTAEMNQALSLATYTNYEGQTLEDADTIARVGLGHQVAHDMADGSESPPPEDVTVKGTVSGTLDPDDMSNEYDEEGYYVTVDGSHDVKVLIRKQATRRLVPTSDPSEPGFESLSSGDVDEIREGDTVSVTGELQLHNIYQSDLRLDGFEETEMAGEGQSAENGRISVIPKDDQYHGATVMNTDTRERDYDRSGNNGWLGGGDTSGPDNPEITPGNPQGDSEPANTDPPSSHNATLTRDGPDPAQTWRTATAARVDTSRIDNLIRPDDEDMPLGDMKDNSASESPD